MILEAHEAWTEIGGSLDPHAWKRLFGALDGPRWREAKRKAEERIAAGQATGRADVEALRALAREAGVSL